MVAGIDRDRIVAFCRKWKIKELSAMLGRTVDLVEKQAIRNPFRRHHILLNREILYAA